MLILYEGADITGDAHLKSARLMDYAGGRCDRVELTFSDPGRLWLLWGAKKGDTLRVSEGVYDTGMMWVDELRYEGGVFNLGAVSAPPAIREAAIREMENVRLSALIADTAGRAGLESALYGQENDPLYTVLAQDGEPNLAFLARRCALEGSAVKIANGVVTVYDEPWAESQAPVREIGLTESSRFYAYSTSAGICSGCRVRGDYEGEFHIPGKLGPVHLAGAAEHGIGRISGAGEARRFARGLLRQLNRWEHCLTAELPLDTELAAGSVVRARLEGAWGGIWIVGALTHEPLRGRSILRLRRPLEGY